MMHARNTRIRGFVTLLSAIVVSAIGVAVVATLLLIGGNTASTTLVLRTSFEAQSFATACAEEALLLIREESPYSGSDSLDFTGGECEFEVTTSQKVS